MHDKKLLYVMTNHKASIENIHQQSRDEKHRLEQENYQVMEASNERMGKLFSDRESRYKAEIENLKIKNENDENNLKTLQNELDREKNKLNEISNHYEKLNSEMSSQIRGLKIENEGLQDSLIKNTKEMVELNDLVKTLKDIIKIRNGNIEKKSRDIDTRNHHGKRSSIKYFRK